MNIGVIAKPNTKGQFVIPNSYRRKFGIVPGTPINVIAREDSIVLYPLTGLHVTNAGASTYYNILAKTRGAWKNGKSSMESKKKLELAASRKRKRAW